MKIIFYLHNKVVVLRQGQNAREENGQQSIPVRGLAREMSFSLARRLSLCLPTACATNGKNLLAQATKVRKTQRQSELGY